MKTLGLKLPSFVSDREHFLELAIVRLLQRSDSVESAKEHVQPVMEKWTEVLLEGSLPQHLRSAIKGCCDKAPYDTYIIYLNNKVTYKKLWHRIHMVADDFLSRLLELRKLFVQSPIDPSEFQRLAAIFQFLAFCDQLHTQFKYWVTVVFNKIMQVPEDEWPVNDSLQFGSSLFDHSLNRIVRTSSHCSQRTRASFFANTIFQGWKKGWTPCRVDTLLKNVKKMEVETLGVPGEPLLDRHVDCIDRLVEQVHKTKEWREFVKDPQVMDSRISASSTIENNRSNGGNLGFLLHTFIKDQYGDELSFALAPAPLIGMLEKGKYLTILGECKLVDRLVVEVRSKAQNYDLLHYAQGASAYTQSQSDVCPSGVGEPGKVRMISIPGILDYAPLMSIQRALWGSLQSVTFGQTFVLTGRTISKEIIEEFDFWNQRHEQGLAGQLDFLVSGDYSQATDLLSGENGAYLIKKLLDPVYVVAPILVQWAVRTLVSSWVRASFVGPPSEDPLTGNSLKKTSKLWQDLINHYDIQDFSQENGQLMGHVLSFPLLCMLNYVAYHLSWETYLGYRLPIVTGPPPVLINGDDIGFRSNPGHYFCWKREIADMGFQMSQGKNFFSKDFLQLNSTLFLFKEVMHPEEYFSWWGSHRARVFDVELVQFVSFALITGRGKGKNADDQRGWKDAYSVGSVKKIQVERSRETELEDHLDDLLSRLRGERSNVHVVKVAAQIEQEAGRLGENPFTTMLLALPRLLWNQASFLGDNLRSRFVELVESHTRNIQRLVRFLPWGNLFRALLTRDVSAFQLVDLFFQQCRERGTGNFQTTDAKGNKLEGVVKPEKVCLATHAENPESTWHKIYATESVTDDLIRGAKGAAKLNRRIRDFGFDGAKLLLDFATMIEESEDDVRFRGMPSRWNF